MEAATSSYSATVEFLQYIYSMLEDKNHQTIRSICLAHEFFFTDIFQRNWFQSSFIKEKFFVAAFNLYWCGFLLLLWKEAQNECVLLKYFYSFSAVELNNIESEDKVFAQEFPCEESDFWDWDDEYI